MSRNTTIPKDSLSEKMSLLIDNCADIIGIVDAATLQIEQMNPSFATLLGYAEEEFQSRTLDSFLDGEGLKVLRQHAASRPEKFSFEAMIYTADKSVKWLNWNVVVRDGKWFVHARDITRIMELNAALERTIAQLEAANRELESFSYSVSHDLRAPLRAVHGNAQAMEEDCLDALDEEARRYLKKIRDGALHMDRLINDLLAFSRIGKKEVRKSAVDMEELVKGIFSDPGRSHRAKVTVSSMPPAWGDRSMLLVVWTNLISNAIKYSSKKEHPAIEAGGTLRGGEVEYFIRDNGAGFDMAYAGKLFGTFQRLHDASEFEGVGIGLAIAQRIILRHEGTIRAEAAPGEGATFYFTLPVESGRNESSG